MNIIGMFAWLWDIIMLLGLGILALLVAFLFKYNK